MKRTRLILSLFLAALAAPSLAANQYIVRIPAKIALPSGIEAPATPTPPVSMALANATLPMGQIGQSYLYDFSSLLSISEPDYNLADISWSITQGALPPGLSLSGSGVIQGAPTGYEGQSFTLEAAYRDTKASHTYDLPLRSINFASTAAVVRIGTALANGGSTTDAYFGPSAYSFSMSTSSAWPAVGAIYAGESNVNAYDRPAKMTSSASTFSGAGNAVSPFNMVIDLGAVRTFNMARYYQTFHDGKTTHVALDVSSSGNLEIRSSPNWNQVHGFSLLDNVSTSQGMAVTFPAVTARYVRIRLYNDGRYGSPSYTELYGFKLFNQ